MNDGSPKPRHSKVQPTVTGSRAIITIRWGWWQDRQCRRHGHKPDQMVGVGMLSGEYWPVCTRCGRGVRPS